MALAYIWFCFQYHLVKPLFCKFSDNLRSTETLRWWNKRHVELEHTLRIIYRNVGMKQQMYLSSTSMQILGVLDIIFAEWTMKILPKEYHTEGIYITYREYHIEAFWAKALFISMRTLPFSPRFCTVPYSWVHPKVASAMAGTPCVFLPMTSPSTAMGPPKLQGYSAH